MAGLKAVLLKVSCVTSQEEVMVPRQCLPPSWSVCSEGLGEELHSGARTGI